MKIAISTKGDNLESKVDERFGRCPKFLIATVENKKITGFEVVTNKGAENAHGAGLLASEQMGELNIDVLITGKVGPKAAQILEDLKIEVHCSSGVISDVLSNFISNKFKATDVDIKKEQVIEEKTDDDEKILFPLTDSCKEDSSISEHFGHAPFFGLYDTKKKSLEILDNKLDHSNPKKSPIDQIEAGIGPTMIFVKGIGKRAIEIINKKGIKLRTGNFTTIRDVIDNLDKLDNKIENCGH